MYKLKFVWRHQKLIIPSLIARSHSIAASNQKLPNAAVPSVSSSPATVDVSGERSGNRSVWG